jgi:phenylacetate-CoA ligase
MLPHPLRFLPRFREAYRVLPRLEQRESWTRSEIVAFQLERLNAVWKVARERVPHYRALTEQHRLPERFASLTEYTSLVPLLDRETVRAEPRRLLASRPGPGYWSVTSGSTGEPVRIFLSRQGALNMLRAKYRFLAAWDVDLLDRSAFLWGRAGTLGGLDGLLGRLRQRAEDWLRGRLRLPAYHLGVNDLRRHLARIGSFRPAMLYAYSTAAMLLAREAQAIGFRCPSLRLAVLTAEPITAAARQAVTQAFGVPVAAEYGSIECGYVAGEHPDGTLRLREDRVILETLPGPAGTYQVVVTVLDNPSFPLLRYRIGDLTSGPLHAPERGFAVMRDVIGRSNDLLVGGSGQLIHPFLLDVLFEALPGVRRWQARQERCGTLRVTIERNDPSVTFNTQDIERQLSEMMDGQPAEVSVTDALTSASGKHRWVVSELTRAHLPALPPLALEVPVTP